MGQPVTVGVMQCVVIPLTAHRENMLNPWRDRIPTVGQGTSFQCAQSQQQVVHMWRKLQQESIIHRSTAIWTKLSWTLNMTTYLLV